jgi:hypothetical protein
MGAVGNVSVSDTASYFLASASSVSSGVITMFVGLAAAAGAGAGYATSVRVRAGENLLLSSLGLVAVVAAAAAAADAAADFHVSEAVVSAPEVLDCG